MFTFGGLVHEIDARYSLGPKAASLARDTLRLVSRYPGGVSGFIRRLRAAGFSVETASWLGGTDLVPLSGDEVEETFGCESVARIAERAEISQSFARTVLGYTIPNVVALLAQRGTVPGRIRASALRFFREAVRRPSFHRVENPRHDLMARSGSRAQDDAAAVSFAPSVIPWATGLIVLGSLVGYFIGAGDRFAAPSTPMVAQTAPMISPPASSLFSPLPPGRTAALFAPDAGRGAAEAGAAAPFDSRGGDQAPAPRLAPDFPVIYFASGRAIIPAGSGSLVHQAARLIRQLPAGSRVEIAGYTDRIGSPAANMRLSQRRAAAVLEALSRAGAEPATLTAKGYGVHPQTAAGKGGTLEGRSNALAEDPLRNERRVEFHFIRPQS